MNNTLTREEHLAKLKELLKQAENDIQTAKGKPGRHDHELILLRQEKEMIEHEIEKLTWFDEKEPVQSAPVVGQSNHDSDGPAGNDKQPALV